MAPPSLWLALRPTDSLSSGGRITGMDLRRLPIDDPRQALALVPGVILTDGAIGIATSAGTLDTRRHAGPHHPDRGSAGVVAPEL